MDLQARIRRSKRVNEERGKLFDMGYGNAYQFGVRANLEAPQLAEAMLDIMIDFLHYAAAKGVAIDLQTLVLEAGELYKHEKERASP